MRIVQVSMAEVAGGAEQVARNLHRAYRASGAEATLAVGARSTDEPGVVELDHPGGPWRRALSAAREPLAASQHRSPVARQLRRGAEALAEPRRALHRWQGVDHFDFPGSHRLLDLAPDVDVVQCHNLHGEYRQNYFDLRILPELSRRVPVVLTLHDAWLLSGHCAHPLGCERWRTGCGACPDLTLYPAVRRDATDRNWLTKQSIYARARLHVAAPASWLAERVGASMLAPAVVETRVIPNGVDLDVFHPGDRSVARQRLGLPDEVPVALFAAHGVRQNPYKDYATLRATAALLAEEVPGLRFLALGEEGPAERAGAASIQFLPHEADPAVVADHYRAADLYLHAARADTFPNSVLEALACGTPVVATDVGGISEQVRTLAADGPEAATGALVAPGDPGSLAAAAAVLIGDGPLHRRLSANAAADARARFSLQRQASAYLAWFAELA